MGFRAVAFSLLAVPFANLALLFGVQRAGPDDLIPLIWLVGGFEMVRHQNGLLVICLGLSEHLNRLHIGLG